MIKVYVDAAYHNGYASGACVVYHNEKQQFFSFPLDNIQNNHEAEFMAMITVLRYLVDNNYHQHVVAIYSDSIVVVKAMERLSVKNSWQQSFVDQLIALLQQFEHYYIDWYNDKTNKLPHQLAREKLRQMRN